MHEIAVSFCELTVPEFAVYQRIQRANGADVPNTRLHEAKNSRQEQDPPTASKNFSDCQFVLAKKKRRTWRLRPRTASSPSRPRSAASRRRASPPLFQGVSTAGESACVFEAPQRRASPPLFQCASAARGSARFPFAAQSRASTRACVWLAERCAGCK